MDITDFPNNIAQGIVIRKSQTSVRETMDLLAKSVEERGATIYVRIDQQAEASKTGIKLAPIEYLLFGNPKKGAPLIATNPLIALDLPLKIICWQDNEGTTIVAFNDQEYIAHRHGFDTHPDSQLNVAPIVDHVLK